MRPPDLKPGEVYYPETDGKPMAESDLHRDLMLDLIAGARYHFRNTTDLYVSGNLLIYYVEGDPTECVAPDFFAVRGVTVGRRRVYKVWEEGKGPEVVVEVTSPSTHREDLGKKRAIYEELAVSEYFLYDPEGLRFQPQLKGYRLDAGVLRPVSAERRAEGELVLRSEILDLELHGCGSSLWWVDPLTGRPIPLPGESQERAERAESRASEAESRAREAESRAREAEQRLRDERDRTEAVSAELDRLRRELDRRQGTDPD